MKVHELMEYLSGCNQNAIVVMSKDSEGNSFSPYSDASDEHYIADTTYYGELAISRSDWQDENLGDDDAGTYEEYLERFAVPALVLWPTN